eukprot:3692128-Rhodomonas_salina.1
MPPITLRTRYAMSCTNVGYTGTAYHLLRLRHAVSGTEKGYVYQVEYRVHRLEQHGTGRHGIVHGDLAGVVRCVDAKRTWCRLWKRN